jgi:hypothetical protein
VGGGQPSSCEFGILLLSLGTAVLVGWALYDKSAQLNTLGGQTISGPLPQLQGPGG